MPFLAPVLKLAFRTQAFGEVREEIRIWDHKVHRARPVLLPHEKGIKALRRWYAQFYDEPVPATTPAHVDASSRMESVVLD
jgi:hypothetical protein